MRFTCSMVLFGLVLLGPGPAVAQFPTVRLATVPSPEETGLLQALLPDFERESGYRVVVYSGEDVHNVARMGQADLVISHYGHSGTEAFMTQGLGLWPRAVFANQIAIVGPTGDPAQIRGLQDAREAFRRIALGRFGSRFVSNNSSIMKYIESVLWEAAGRPPKDSWYLDSGLSEADGVAVAARMKAYYIFALPPFLRWQEACLDNAVSDGSERLSGIRSFIPHYPAPCGMDALVLADMPARIMVSIIVNPQRVPAVNLSGATALQEYLLRPSVQARIESFRDPRSGYQIWKGSGLHNSGASLGFGRRP